MLFIHFLYIPSRNRKSMERSIMKKLQIKPIGRFSILFLRIAMPLILLSALAILLSYLSAHAISPTTANLNYPPQLEYIAASVTIAAAGVLLIDLTERDLEKQ